jgi:hypothetical protein
MTGIKVSMNLSVDQIQEVKMLLTARKKQLEMWIKARHVSENEKNSCRDELIIVTDLIEVFF